MPIIQYLTQALIYKQIFQLALAAWKKQKQMNGMSYRYVVGFSSWTGFGNQTTIVVKEDRVIARHYLAWGQMQKIIDSWHETIPSTLGSHKMGAKAKRVEDLYQECQQNILRKSKKDNHIYFTAHNNGILKSCVYAPKACADDCLQGVKIKQLDFN